MELLLLILIVVIGVVIVQSISISKKSAEITRLEKFLQQQKEQFNQIAKNSRGIF